MKNDVKLRDDVLDELCFEPSIDENEIGVIVKRGVVTLTGHVNSYAQKLAAERAALRVEGVRAIAEEIQVDSPTTMYRTDPQIAEAAINALQWNSSIPIDKVTVKVEDGLVYLDGKVDWQYQKTAAKNAVGSLRGVKNVINRIGLKSIIKTKDVSDQITKALERAARIDASHISVKAQNHEVTLKGAVHSWAEREQAESAAYKAAGVWTVKNELVVEE